jgi:hypothetical protein
MSDHDIGYGKPPKHTRWKKGQSGNPRGRPAKGKSFKNIIPEELDRVVTITENGRQVNVTVRRMVVRGMAAKAAKGNVPAAEWLSRHGPADAFEDGPIEFTLVFEEERRREQLLQKRKDPSR